MSGHHNNAINSSTNLSERTSEKTFRAVMGSVCSLFEPNRTELNQKILKPDRTDVMVCATTNHDVIFLSLFFSLSRADDVFFSRNQLFVCCRSSVFIVIVPCSSNLAINRMDLNKRSHHCFRVPHADIFLWI